MLLHKGKTAEILHIVLANQKAFSIFTSCLLCSQCRLPLSSDVLDYLSFFFFYFCPNAISPIPEESQLRQSRTTQPTVHAGCFRNLPNSDMDYGIFDGRTDVNVCNCTQGCTDTVRVCTES